ncbi:HK97 gp10 family phage protein [Sphingomonas endolithica]|uniref:HK97 gp10 family phage protein n=1 Tax=Sphingomonas endolithica TaxID=2972485 RepID=UPI0021AF1FA9|nr:HK97 gp10 family phage protein [Sphingomonas sp. ZFBP2030]
MPTVRGKSEVRSFIAGIPGEMKKVLRGAGRAGAKVVADEMKVRSISQDVDDAIVTKTKGDDTRVVVKISIKPGWARSVATWLEYGTDPHFISVSDGERQGMSVKRVNEQTKTGSMVIGGKFVGETVFHPGARAHPFMRVSLDVKGAEAVAAARSYINSRVSRSGILPSNEPESDEA